MPAHEKEMMKPGDVYRLPYPKTKCFYLILKTEKIAERDYYLVKFFANGYFYETTSRVILDSCKKVDC